MPKYEVYAPLSEFEWPGSEAELIPGFWLRRRVQKPELRGLNAGLALDEQDTITMVDHWLEFQWTEAETPSAAEWVNLALLAFWLTKPTKAHATHRFQLDCGPPQGRLDRTSRLLDRFAWVPGATAAAFDDADVRSAGLYLPTLAGLCRARGRLNDALVLTLTGCWSHKWQVALICHAAAAEAILTYSTGPGITRRLSTSYACLVATTPTDRDTAFREFAALYGSRSDIMHGRTYNVPQSDRLSTLARFGNALRNLWRVVLSSQFALQALEGTDVQRQTWFTAHEAGYTPPP